MTSKLTREERVQSLYDLKTGQVLNPSDIENIKMLARMALTALDSEPVYQVFEPSDGVWVDVDDEEEMIRQRSIGGITRTLYSAPPVPVSSNAPAVEGGEVYQIWSAGICQWVECDKSRYDAHASLPAQRRVLYTISPAMNSEPVAWRWRWSDDAEGYWRYTEEQRETRGSVTAQPLYRHAQPAAVVPESICVRQAISALERADAVTTIGQAYKLGWNACRAAMLQEPQKSAGAANNCRSNENVQDLQVDNSPVIPDGYVMVPKEPTAEMIAAAMNCDDVEFNSDETFCVNFDNIYAAMLAAAPQEVKSE